MSGTRGSSGLGSHKRLHIDSNTVGGGREEREEGKGVKQTLQQCMTWKGKGMKKQERFHKAKKYNDGRGRKGKQISICCVAPYL